MAGLVSMRGGVHGNAVFGLPNSRFCFGEPIGKHRSGKDASPFPYRADAAAKCLPRAIR